MTTGIAATIASSTISTKCSMHAWEKKEQPGNGGIMRRYKVIVREIRALSYMLNASDKESAAAALTDTRAETLALVTEDIARHVVAVYETDSKGNPLSISSGQTPGVSGGFFSTLVKALTKAGKA